MKNAAESIRGLTPSEKLQLVEDLWDDLASNPADVPIHEWQIEELKRRKAILESRPESGMTWEEVRSVIRSRHGH